MDDAGGLAFRTGFGDFFLVTAEVTGESIAISMQSHGEVTIRAEGLPTAVFAEGERGRTAAIMKNQGLMMVFEILLDIFE